MRRLFSQRGIGLGKRIQGKLRARAIRGTPRSVGLTNWSKKLRIMVNLRALLGGCLSFGVRGRLEKCVVEFLG